MLSIVGLIAVVSRKNPTFMLQFSPRFDDVRFQSWTSRRSLVIPAFALNKSHKQVHRFRFLGSSKLVCLAPRFAPWALSLDS